MMEIFWEELTTGLPETRQLARLIIRLLAATLLGAVIGLERERAGKPAGLRTHILVTLGTTVFVVACSSVGMSSEGVSRVIQGIATGIGFIGAGAILKLTEERDIQGLTTAAGIWMTAAVGVAVGVGSLGVAVLSTVLTLLVLASVGSLEYRMGKGRAATDEDSHPRAGARNDRDRGAT
jgi:putative Mg2+ transporter-C (MgtC) family protein